MEHPLSLPPGPAQPSALSRIHQTSAQLQRYKLLLLRRWWFLLLTASIGVCYQALMITNEPETYRALAKLVAGGRIVAQDSAVAWQEQLTDFYGTIIETLEGADLKRQTMERVERLYPELKKTDVNIRVTQNRGSAIFNVFATGSEPQFTQTFLNALLDQFMIFRQQLRDQGMNRAMDNFMASVVKKNEELRVAGEKLEAFRKSNNVVLLNNGNNEAAAFLLNHKTKREALVTEMNDIKLALEDVDAMMINRERLTAAQGATSGAQAPKPTSSSSEGGNPTVVESVRPGSMGLTSRERDWIETKNEIMRLENERLKELKKFKEQHPTVVSITEQIESKKILLQNFEEEIVKELRSELADRERRIKVLDQQIAEREKEALDIVGKLAEHERLEEEFRANKLAYERMFERAQNFQDAQNVQTDYVGIQEQSGPAYPQRPDWVVPLLVGLGAGLAVGLVVLFLYDRLDDRMNSVSEFLSIFPSESVLGQIPEQRQRGDVTLLQVNDPRHLYVEAFRQVRSSILFKNWQGKSPKTILVTSAVPNEGKTTVTCNLAVTMATAGSRVLLVDCDLRRGGVCELFKRNQGPGLSEVLRGSIHWRDAVQETGFHNLDLLARGQVYDQTSEMLLSKTADEVLREMSAEYDYVIFDSAPVLVADDTGSFAPKIDTVLFVVRLSSTLARLSAKAMELLHERQVNVGGVILNRSTTNLKEYTYYNYASYYQAPAAKALGQTKG